MNPYLIKLDDVSLNIVNSYTQNGYQLMSSNSIETNKNYRLINPKVTLEFGAAGSLEFTLPPEHPMYDGYGDMTQESISEKTQTRWTQGTITLFEEEDIIFSGRVYSWKIDMYKRKTLCCEGALAFLHDSIQPYAEYDNVLLDSLVTTFLSYHNMQVSDNRKIYPGYLDQLTGPAVYRQVAWQTTWDALQQFVIDTNGGYFVIRTIDEGNGVYKHYLDYYNTTAILFTSGESGYNQDMLSEQTIELGQNLLDITESFSMDDVMTQILPLGATILADQQLEELGFKDDEENAKTLTGTTVRKDAGTEYQPVNNYAGLPAGAVLTVNGVKEDVNGAKWYAVKYKVKITGFVYAAHTNKLDDYDADGYGEYGSAQVTADSTPVRMGASSSFGVVTDYDPEDATDESQFLLGATFSVKGVFMDVNGTGDKWFYVEFPEKTPTGYVPVGAIEPTNGYTQAAPYVSSISSVPVGTSRITALRTELKSSPSESASAVSGAPELPYGKLVEVCDIVYPSGNFIWYYIKVDEEYYGYVVEDALNDISNSVLASLPNNRNRIAGVYGNAATGVDNESTPGFFTDTWGQALSLTTDNRRTIASWNNGSLILTIEDALAFEDWYINEKGEYLNGDPVFTGGGPVIVEPCDLGGYPVRGDSLNRVLELKIERQDAKQIYFNGGTNDALERFGKITKVVEFSNCKSSKELKHKASQYLLDHCRYPVEITCSSADLHFINLEWPKFKIGQFVPIKCPGWRSEYSWGASPYFTDNASYLRILKLEIDMATGSKSISIGTQKRKDLTEITKEIKDEAERDKNKIKVMTNEQYNQLTYVDPDKIYFCAGD